MSDLKSLVEKSENKGLDIISYISRHRTVIIVFVACTAIMASLMQTQTYLNPTRNEDKYNEIKSSISAKKIDEEKLKKLQTTDQNTAESVNSNFVPDRNNPFTE